MTWLALVWLILVPLVALSENSATNPVPREGKWLERHENFITQAKRGGIELLFLGDSITFGWQGEGRAVWDEFYTPRRAANFGIGGDRTQHLLWRIHNGELHGIKPKVVVLLIGTNNTGKERNSDKARNTTPEAIEGVTAVVRALRTRLPKSRILLLAIFPRGERSDPIRDQVTEINTALARLVDDKRVTFLDLGPHFLAPDGTLSREIMPDLLHLSAKGYQLWSEAMEPTLQRLLK